LPIPTLLWHIEVLDSPSASSYGEQTTPQDVEGAASIWRENEAGRVIGQGALGVEVCARMCPANEQGCADYDEGHQGKAMVEYQLRWEIQAIGFRQAQCLHVSYPGR